MIVTVFAGGNLISMVLRLAGGIMTARFVPPSVLGLFNGMGLILGYAPFLQLGVLNGLNRELPYYIGRDDRSRALELAAAAQCWALAIGVAAALSLLAVAAWNAAGGRLDLAAGWSTYALSIFVLFYSQLYLQTTYRTGGDFARLSVINVVQNSVALVLVVLVWLFGYYGLCLRLALMGSVGAVLCWKWRPIRVSPRWNRAELFHLVKVGGPIFIVGQIYAWWVVLDSTMVLKFAGVKGLGLYQLAIMSGQALETLPLAVSQIVYPRMAEEFGRSGSLTNIVRIVLKPILITSVCMAGVAAVCWWLLPFAVKVLMPSYLDGVPAARWSVVAAALLSLAPLGNVFNVHKRQDMYLIAIVAGMLAYFGSLMLLNASGMQLVHFPQALIIGRVVFLTVCFFMVQRLVNRNEKT